LSPDRGIELEIFEGGRGKETSTFVVRREGTTSFFLSSLGSLASHYANYKQRSLTKHSKVKNWLGETNFLKAYINTKI